MEEEIITVEVATEKHLKYVDEILKTIEDAAKCGEQDTGGEGRYRHVR